MTIATESAAASGATTTLPMTPGMVRSVELNGPSGRLEGLLNTGSPDAPFSALICHPHPKGGGTMHNKVVFHAMKVLNDPAWGFGFPALRFNFRGTGLSEGKHHGRDETGDVLAAVDWLANAYNRPVIVAGFSFGAAMALSACCTRSSRVQALAALGLPTEAAGREYQYPFLQHCTFPKFFLSGDRDQFVPADQLKQLFAATAEPKQFSLIPGADHLFTGHLDEVQRALAGWLKEQLP